MECLQRLLCCSHHKKTASPEEVDLWSQSEEEEPLLKDQASPPDFPRLIIGFQGVQQMGTFCFGLTTGLMASHYLSSPYCNVTVPEGQPNCINYNCTIQAQEDSPEGIISLAATIIGSVFCIGGSVGAYLVTKSFLTTVKLKEE